MDLVMKLRMCRDRIAPDGMIRFARPRATVYAANNKSRLLRQQKAMELLSHLEVAPSPGAVKRLRGLWVMEVRHPPLQDYRAVLSGSRRNRVELIRRLGALIGILHSIRHPGTGDILGPNPISISETLTASIRRYRLLILARGERREPFSRLSSRVQRLWDRAEGGTLVGAWPGFPPLGIWESGLMIMDLGRSCYFEPLWDLAGVHSKELGLKTGYFWEHFLQGYCATGELPGDWKEKVQVLCRIRLLESLATGDGVQRAREILGQEWWKDC